MNLLPNFLNGRRKRDVRKHRNRLALLDRRLLVERAGQAGRTFDPYYISLCKERGVRIPRSLRSLCTVRIRFVPIYVY